jgi:hypothetical protein
MKPPEHRGEIGKIVHRPYRDDRRAGGYRRRAKIVHGTDRSTDGLNCDAKLRSSDFALSVRLPVMPERAMAIVED